MINKIRNSSGVNTNNNDDVDQGQQDDTAHLPGRNYWEGLSRTFKLLCKYIL